MHNRRRPSNGLGDASREGPVAERRANSSCFSRCPIATQRTMVIRRSEESSSVRLRTQLNSAGRTQSLSILCSPLSFARPPHRRPDLSQATRVHSIPHIRIILFSCAHNVIAYRPCNLRPSGGRSPRKGGTQVATKNDDNMHKFLSLSSSSAERDFLRLLGNGKVL